MSKLTKQILIKVSPEFDELIERAHSAFLKETGEPTTKSEYIRQILQAACDAQLLKSKERK